MAVRRGTPDLILLGSNMLLCGGTTGVDHFLDARVLCIKESWILILYRNYTWTIKLHTVAGAQSCGANAQKAFLTGGSGTGWPFNLNWSQSLPPGYLWWNMLSCNPQLTPLPQMWQILKGPKKISQWMPNVQSVSKWFYCLKPKTDQIVHNVVHSTY